MESGALGGKLIGSGGGGFLLFMVPPEKRRAFNRATEGFIKIDFSVDKHGSIILYNSGDLI